MRVRGLRDSLHLVSQRRNGGVEKKQRQKETKPGCAKPDTCFLYYVAGMCRHPERYGMKCDEGECPIRKMREKIKGGNDA